MWALRKKPENLTTGQRTALAHIAADNKHLYKGYLMKEQLREAFKAKGEPGKALLAGLIAWAQRCRIPEFAKLAENLRPVPGPHLRHPRRRTIQRVGFILFLSLRLVVPDHWMTGSRLFLASCLSLA